MSFISNEPDKDRNYCVASSRSGKSSYECESESGGRSVKKDKLDSENKKVVVRQKVTHFTSFAAIMNYGFNQENEDFCYKFEPNVYWIISLAFLGSMFTIGVVTILLGVYCKNKNFQVLFFGREHYETSKMRSELEVAQAKPQGQSVRDQD
eukprot:TRINITY_DN630_c0_g1_i1.p1 TRINITY_DN630_c0_g1~~TRINITY_DN630_c0_g1_i1.p1  ORF type:complete len:151 (+),score=18.06 TRINITY_DN630_c0_g1_i1:568-1020(+)